MSVSNKAKNSKASKKLKNDLILECTLGVFDIKGKEVGKIELDSKVFDGKVNSSLIHQAVVAFLANQRKGLAKTKTRGQVRGGGRKPWRQKGTGRARVGSIRSPIWRGGGVTFGPVNRSYHKDLPKKMKVLALKSALNLKLSENQILIIDDLEVKSHKTKDFAKILDNLKLGGQKVNVVLEKLENDTKLSSRNIKKAQLAKASDVHTTEIIDCKKLVLTKKALEEIQKRVKKWL